MEHIAQLNADIQQNKQLPSLQETQSCEDDQFNLQQLLKQDEMNYQLIETDNRNSQQTNSLNYIDKDNKQINNIEQYKLDVSLQDRQQDIMETKLPSDCQEISVKQSLEGQIQKDGNINQQQIQTNNPFSSSILPSELFSYSQNQLNNKQSSDYIQSSQHTLSSLNSSELSQIPDFPQIGSPLDLSLLDLEIQQQLNQSEIIYNEIGSQQYELYPTFPFESFISDKINQSISDQHSYLQQQNLKQDQQNQILQIYLQLEDKDYISNKLSELQNTTFQHLQQPINSNLNQLIESQANIQDIQNNQNNNKQKDNQSSIQLNQQIQSKYPPYPKQSIKLPPIPSPPQIVLQSDQQDQLQDIQYPQLTNHSKQSLSSISEQDDNIVLNEYGKDKEKEFEQQTQQNNKLKQQIENHNDILQQFSNTNSYEQLNNLNGMNEEQQIYLKIDEFQIIEQNQQQNNFSEYQIDGQQSNNQQQTENQIIKSKDLPLPPHFPTKSRILTQIPVFKPQIKNIETLYSLSMNNKTIEQEKQNTQENQIEDNYKKKEKQQYQTKEQQDQQKSEEQQDQQIQSVNVDEQQYNNSFDDTHTHLSSNEQEQLEQNKQYFSLAPPGLDKPEQDIQQIPQLESSSQLLQSSYLPSLSSSTSSSSSQLKPQSKAFTSQSSSSSQYQAQLLKRDQQFSPQFTDIDNLGKININKNQQISNLKNYNNIINNIAFSPFQISRSQFQSPSNQCDNSSTLSQEISPSSFLPKINLISESNSQRNTPYQQFSSSPTNINAYLSQSSQMPLITQIQQQPQTFKQQSYPEKLQNAQSSSSNSNISNIDNNIENIHHLSQNNIIQQNPPINETDQNVTFTPNSFSSISQYQQSPDYQNSNTLSNPKFDQSQLESQMLLQQQQIQQYQQIQNYQQKLKLQEIQSIIQKLNQQKLLLEQYYQKQLLLDSQQIDSYKPNSPQVETSKQLNNIKLQQQNLKQDIGLQLQYLNQIYEYNRIASNNSTPSFPSVTQTNQSTSQFISSPNFNSQTPQNAQNTPQQYFMLGPFQSNSEQQQQQMVQFQPIQQQYNIYDSNFNPFNYSQSKFNNNKQLKKYHSQSNNEIINDQLQYQLFHYEGRNSYKKQQPNKKQKQKFAMIDSKKCFHCGQLGHVHANCPYHALLTATTEEERIFAEQQIHQALKAVGGQGWRGQINRTETKINLEDQQNKQNQEDNLDTEIKSNGDNQDNDVQSNKEKVVSYEILCFRCGKLGHTSKECKFEDNRICFRCGGVGHTAKYCPENNNKKVKQTLQQQDKK